MMWALEDARDDRMLVVKYPYFEHADPVADDSDGTYVESDVKFEHTRSHSWNHGLGEIISSLLDARLTRSSFSARYSFRSARI